MLFNVLAKEVKGNTYIDNYLNDTLEIENATITEDYEKTLDVSLRNSYNDTIRNGTIKVYINDNELPYLETDVTNGNANIKILNKDLPLKENIITVKYVTLSKHYQNITTSFKLEKEIVNSNITVYAPETIKIGKNVSISGKLFEEYNQSKPITNAEVELYINGTYITKALTNETTGNYTFNYSPTSMGSCNATVIFKGFGKYNQTSNETSFMVLPLNTKVTISAEDTVWGLKSVINGTLYDTDNNVVIKNQIVSVMIIDQYRNESVIVDENGNFRIEYTTDIVNEFIVQVVFDLDNSNYTSAFNETAFAVLPRQTNMTIDNNESVLVGTNFYCFWFVV